MHFPNLYSVTSCLAVTVALCAPQSVQAQVRVFDVPAQSASEGVRLFARQAGIQIIVESKLTQGRQVNAVKGNLDTAAALETLLSGTGLAVRSFDGSIAILGAGGQEAATPSAEIVVTGSRVIRDGYEAPTPMTVLGAEEIAAAAPNNIADLINRLPAVAGSANPRTQVGQISNGGTGINALNLRNLGPARTLVLLDGKRVPVATISTGLVDINSLPNTLIKRVDIVTGGASAAWGSDAVAGVVNFVLDKEFSGIKGSVEGGITTYGDDENFKVALAAGTPFAAGRGHALLSFENSYSAGIKGLPRAWYTGAKLFNNSSYTATNGQPEYLVRENTGFSTVAPGAIVTSGPLRGVYFGPNGAPSTLNYGSVVNDPFMTGGDWQYTDFGKGQQDLDPMISRQSAFARLSYEITDNIQLYGQFSFGRAHTSMLSTPQFNFGGITIQRDNAFLPEEVGTRMDELGLTSLNVGSWNADLGGIRAETVRKQYRYMIGAEGRVDLFGSQWAWDVYGNRNISKIYNSAIATITSRYRSAIDAVRDPNGAIVCRSTLTDPTNGCVAYNILGTGTASDAAKNYVLDNSNLHGKLKQDVIAASFRGEPVSTWAGPVSIAAGFEHRREALSGEADPLSLSNSFWAGNFKPINGSYHVNEGFLEAVIPLASDLSWAKSLDVNAAVRATDYSTSGFVTTWKAGINFIPIEDIRIRATRSRDIRAGNLAELYAAGQSQNFTIADPFKNNETTNYFQIQGGNPNLKPEKADTLDVGVVLQPRFLPGFSASVDYFDIKTKDAVITLGGATLLSECFRGATALCEQIDRDSAGKITQIRVAPINFAQQLVRGIDFEASYRLPLNTVSETLGNGSASIRALATRYLKAELDNGIDNPDSNLGENAGGTPKWRYLVQAMYSNGPLTLSVTGRGVSSGKYNAAYIECASACPASTPQNRTIDNNRIAGAFYIDASTSFKIWRDVELFVAVDNITNKKPPVVASGPGIGSAPLGVSGTYYDLIGRMFRSGIRFSL